MVEENIVQKFLVVGYDGHLVYEKKGKLKKVKCFISPRVRDLYKCMYVCMCLLCVLQYVHVHVYVPLLVILCLLFSFSNFK